MNTNTDESPLPPPPFHTLPNIHNLRDAALSVTISTGASLRPNILFRSADVSKLDIGPEIDKTLVVTSTEDKTWIEKMQQAGVTRTWTPIFSEHDYSPEKIAVRFAKYMEEDVRGFVEAYTSILNEAGPAFGVIFRYLADLPAPGSTGDSEGEKLGALVHCTAGKDRTGLFYAVLFAFLDVPAEQIAVEV
ncbi:tyrosine phosphatase [Pyrenophora tritici-repentis]|nr:tyrosine phosphatase [Pyrenophora tritici-repentis]